MASLTLAVRYPQWFGGIHDDPRFDPLLARMGLTRWRQWNPAVTAAGAVAPD